MNANQASAAQPLAGVRVLEFSTMVSASLATMMLASQGAEVIKVEPVESGDVLRYIGTQKSGISAIFANCNRGKSSLAVDLKSKGGQDLVKNLAAKSDVVISNFRTGVMERLSLGSDALREKNPRLIFAAVSGFGLEGPMAKDPAYDQVVQALSGFVGVQTVSDQPSFVRNLIVDKVTALTIAQGITSALLARATTGEGQHIDVSMLQAGLFFLFPDGMMNQTFLSEGVLETPPLANHLVAFATSDGFISMAPSTDSHWRGFAKAVDRPDIAEDPRYETMEARASNGAELYAEAYKALAQFSTEEAIRRLRENDIPCAPCLLPDDVVEHQQVNAIGALAVVDHPSLGKMRVAQPPIRFAGELGHLAKPCPTLGQHSVEVARDAGLSDSEIARMQADRELGGQ